MKYALAFIAAIILYAIYQEYGIANVTRFVSAAIAGLACGLLPFLSQERRNPKFAKTALWVSGFAGILGGALLALPVAVVMFIIGRRKSTTAGREPQEPTVEQLP